jgi:hypothetical protein
MANQERGEVELRIGEKTYTLKFTRNAMAEVEAVFGGRPFNLLMGDGSISVIRALLWGGLRKHHAGIDLLQAGDLMEQVDEDDLGAAIGKAISLAFVKTVRPR